jgi:hypothetical protein
MKTAANFTGAGWDARYGSLRTAAIRFSKASSSPARISPSTWAIFLKTYGDTPETTLLAGFSFTVPCRVPTPSPA